MTTQQPKPSFERHLQTGIAAVLVGLVGWIGLSITSMAETQARLDERVHTMQRDIDKMSAKIEGGILPQTRVELRSHQDQINRHEKLLGTIWPRLREIKERIQRLEGSEGERWQY